MSHGFLSNSIGSCNFWTLPCPFLCLQVSTFAIQWLTRPGPVRGRLRPVHVYLSAVADGENAPSLGIMLTWPHSPHHSLQCPLPAGIDPQFKKIQCPLVRCLSCAPFSHTDLTMNTKMQNINVNLSISLSTKPYDPLLDPPPALASSLSRHPLNLLQRDSYLPGALNCHPHLQEVCCPCLLVPLLVSLCHVPPALFHEPSCLFLSFSCLKSWNL